MSDKKKKRIKELEEKIRHHKAKYYQGHPEITDHEYDKLEEELESLDPDNKVLKIVGSSPKGSNKVSHDTKMLSLNKTYKFEDLISWIDDKKAVSTFKIDGVSCSLIYENGSMTIAKTRGDGSVGEDITDKVLWMQNVPPAIKEKSRLEVRGEIFCDEKDFFHLSDEMEEIGLEKPTSQRNIVAGLIGRNENIELCRYIQFKAFDLIEEKISLKTEEEKHTLLKDLEFGVPDLILHKKEEDIKERLEEAEKFMAEGDFQIDGLVFSYNDLKLHEELGSTSHHPRYKIAFKFQGVSKETKIKGITWQVSRNGILTPIAEVEAVELSGAKISRVTLHNYGMVRQFNLKKGDVIEIIRSGEVIPKFMSVAKPTDGNFITPDECPSCGGKVRVDDIRLFCDNDSCPAQIKEQILNYIQKIGIDDLSSKRLEEMIRAGLIKEIPDLYELKKEDLLSLDKVKDKLANKLLKSIEKSKEVDLITFLGSLGIQGGAYNKCEKVVFAGFNTLEKIKKMKQKDLEEIEGFAEKSATEFYRSLQDKMPLINKLEKHGFKFDKVDIKDSPITKKKICITGTLSRKRSEIEKFIRDNGGIVVGSVSKNTDYLLTNDDKPTSSKFKKAKELDVPIITEDGFYDLVEGD